MKKQRLFPLFLTIALILTLISGCTQPINNDAQNPPQNQQSAKNVTRSSNNNDSTHVPAGIIPIDYISQANLAVQPQKFIINFYMIYFAKNKFLKNFYVYLKNKNNNYVQH